MQQIVEDKSMIAYAVLMWAIAALFLLLGLLIYHGKTGLIHEYHRERVRSEDMGSLWPGLFHRTFRPCGNTGT